MTNDPSATNAGQEQQGKANADQESLSPLATTTSTDTNAGKISKERSKTPAHRDSLRVPSSGLRARSRSPDTISLVSADEFSELRQLPSVSTITGDVYQEPTEKPRGFKARCRAQWGRNKGLFMVLIAQIFGTIMNVTTRLLEIDGPEGQTMDPFQILFARMGITYALCMLYMWYQKVEDFPFGKREVRGLLVARGVGGFFGVFGLYWSLQYLPLSDATVLTFLAPMLACWACSKLINEPFTRTEQIATFVSIIGVFLIARPSSIFSATSNSSSEQESSSPTNATTPHTGAIPLHRRSSTAPPPTSKQRVAAVGMAMLGVAGAAVAYTTIRWIGKRAHPLVSVNYFAAWCTIVSSIALAFVPSVPFLVPTTSRQWFLLVLIGISGFTMQFLLTAGLRYEKSSRATNMVYSQMLFALGFDKVIWGTTPGVVSVVGSSLILGGAIVVAVQKERTATGEKASSDEERGLMSNDGGPAPEAESHELEEREGRASGEHIQVDEGHDDVSRR